MAAIYLPHCISVLSYFHFRARWAPPPVQCTMIKVQLYRSEIKRVSFIAGRTQHKTQRQFTIRVVQPWKNSHRLQNHFLHACPCRAHLFTQNDTCVMNHRNQTWHRSDGDSANKNVGLPTSIFGIIVPFFLSVQSEGRSSETYSDNFSVSPPSRWAAPCSTRPNCCTQWALSQRFVWLTANCNTATPWSRVANCLSAADSSCWTECWRGRAKKKKKSHASAKS